MSFQQSPENSRTCCRLLFPQTSLKDLKYGSVELIQSLHVADETYTQRWQESSPGPHSWWQEQLPDPSAVFCAYKSSCLQAQSSGQEWQRSCPELCCSWAQPCSLPSANSNHTPYPALHSPPSAPCDSGLLLSGKQGHEENSPPAGPSQALAKLECPHMYRIQQR